MVSTKKLLSKSRAKELPQVQNSAFFLVSPCQRLPGQHGFDLKMSGNATGCMFGPGAYFAESSSKCDEYAKEAQTAANPSVIFVAGETM